MRCPTREGLVFDEQGPDLKPAPDGDQPAMLLIQERDELKARVAELQSQAWAPSLDALDALVVAVRSLEKSMGGEQRAETTGVLDACEALREYSNEHEVARVGHIEHSGSDVETPDRE